MAGQWEAEISPLREQLFFYCSVLLKKNYLKIIFIRKGHENVSSFSKDKTE